MDSTPVTPQQAVAADVPPRKLLGRPSIRGRKEQAILLLTLACAMVSVLTTLGIIGVLARETILFFSKVSPAEFFTGTDWSPTYANPKFGILPLVAGTLMITVGSAIIAVPFGLLVAIYLSEYSATKVRRILKPTLEMLAGIPTVVYGYFALITITPLLRKFIPDVQIFNAASGAIVVGIMILPLVSSLCEDALSAVPKSLRDGGYALGSTKYEVTTKITVPAALSGIMAAIVLAVSRAIGETMAVSLAAGQTPKLTLDPRQSIETMTAYIVQISRGDTPEGSTAFQTIFAVGATLFVATMLLNILARKLVRRFRQVYA
jgi:phosphate transport system permease protein